MTPMMGLVSLQEKEERTRVLSLSHVKTLKTKVTT